MYSLYHSFYNEFDQTLHGLHESGFYSCINEVRNSLYRLMNEKIYPKKISFENTLAWYRNSEDLYPILYKTDSSKIDGLKDHTFNFTYFCPTALDLKTFDFEKADLVEKVYFSPSDRVLERVESLKKKYDIDYENTLAILHRGTDKHREATLLSKDEWCQHIKSRNDKDYRVLIQTDELQFRNCFEDTFPNSFFFDEMIFRNAYVLPSDFKVQWSVDFEAIMHIISKCKKIVTHSGNVGFIPVLYRRGLHGVSQCFNTGTFVNLDE